MGAIRTFGSEEWNDFRSAVRFMLTIELKVLKNGGYSDYSNRTRTLGAVSLSPGSPKAVAILTLQVDP
jgi:hypothetical protein